MNKSRDLKKQIKKLLVLFAFFLTFSNVYAINVKIGYPKVCNANKIIKIYGKIKTTQNITIFAPIDGVIKTDSSFKSVKEGQLIAEIYPPNLEKKIKYASANAESAYKNLENTIKLKKERIATSLDVEKAKMLYYQAENNLENFNAYLKQSRLTAAFSGNLEYLVPNGSYVNVNQPIAVLSGSNDLWIEGYVPVNYIENLKIGDKVYYYINNIKYKGKIAQVIKSADTSGFARIFVNADHINNLIPGMWTSLTISLKTVRGFCLPKSAIISKGSKTYIYRVEKNKVYLLRVHLINLSGNIAHIRGNFNSYTPVAIDGAEYLKNNAELKAK